MTTHVPLLPFTEWTPQIDRTLIPPDQMEAFFHIQTLLGSLAVFERRFILTVFLFDFCEKERQELMGAINRSEREFAEFDRTLDTLNGWDTIAARDGALSIYHFGSTLEAVKRSLPTCPALNVHIDHKIIRRAIAQFHRDFPRYKGIRHLIAHVADFASTIEQRKRHAKQGPYKLKFVETKDANASSYFAGNLYDRSFHVTFKGEICHYDITNESVAKLNTAKIAIYSCFRGISTSIPLA